MAENSEIKSSDYAIECKEITKTFGTVVANDHVDLSVKYGEILALLGENGSGKTTLMNMLSGIYHPDGGSINVLGRHAVINSPADSIALGIGMIHQHFKLVEAFSALDNIIAGTPGKLKKRSALCEDISAISKKLGLNVDLSKKIYNMSVSEKQTVEILKVLYRGAKILILDEPTAVLTPQETEKLFDMLRIMRSEGCAIIIITHKLNEVMAISDRVTILRKGKSVETVLTAETNEKKLTELMVGKPVSLSIERPEPIDPKPLLNVYHLSVDKPDGTVALEDVTFDIYSGEILGVAGVAGSGQKELCETIAGLNGIRSGAVLYNKENIIGKSAKEIIELGISMSFVPEDRLGMGLVGSMGMTGNMMLRSWRKGHGVFLNRKDPEDLAKRIWQELDVVTPSTNFPVRRMSGGNVQKVLVGREIAQAPSVLMTAYAVRGLDINTSYTIYNLLTEQKMKGIAVVYVGEDLDVLLELCDRIVVLCGGRVSGVVDARTADKRQVGALMTQMEGGKADE